MREEEKWDWELGWRKTETGLARRLGEDTMTGSNGRKQVGDTWEPVNRVERKTDVK